jgi:hypothetical protein
MCERAGNQKSSFIFVKTRCALWIKTGYVFSRSILFLVLVIASSGN